MPATSELMRARLRRGDVLVGAWTQISDLAAAAVIASAGYDYVVLDLQHGSVSEAEIAGMCAIIANGGATPLVRTRGRTFADIGRPADLGALGLIVPNVSGYDEAALVLQHCSYPPAGQRSTGRLLGDVADPLRIIMVESGQAADELPQTLTLPGIDAVYVGPGDLSLSLGCALDFAEPVLAEVLQKVLSACRAAGVPVGVHATTPDRAQLPRQWGCQLLTVFSDLSALAEGATRSIEMAGGDPR
jgi:4-hydroxy-2-oxoheptanedioate aldolase